MPILVRGLIVMLGSMILGQLGAFSKVWAFAKTIWQEFAGGLAALLDSIRTAMPIMPDTTELEKVAYTLEQAGWSVRYYLQTLEAVAIFALGLLSLRLLYRAKLFIK